MRAEVSVGSGEDRPLGRWQLPTPKVWDVRI